MKAMKMNKAVGPDNIPIEMWKCLCDFGTDMLWDLMRKIFSQEKMPSAWRNSSAIPLYKEKDDMQQCYNYRGIKLLSHIIGSGNRAGNRGKD